MVVQCNITYCGGKQLWFYHWLSPQCGAFSRDLLNEKSKSPLFHGAGGVVTNDWCSNVSVLIIEGEQTWTQYHFPDLNPLREYQSFWCC